MERTGELQGAVHGHNTQGGLVAELMVRQGMTVSAGESPARVNVAWPRRGSAAVPEAHKADHCRSAKRRRSGWRRFPVKAPGARIVSILARKPTATSRTVRVRLEMRLIPASAPEGRACLGQDLRLKATNSPRCLFPAKRSSAPASAHWLHAVDGPASSIPWRSRWARR
ncbi:hypothetical protein ACPA9J_03850 [Pseudomonas aeruginosa]